MNHRSNRSTRTRIRRRHPLRNTILLSLAAAALLYAAGASSLRRTVTPEAENAAFATTQPAAGTNETSETDDAFLTLVNPWNQLPADFSVELKQLKNGQSVDSRCYPDLQRMMDDCRAAGLSPLICSSYRTQFKQEQLYQNKVEQMLAGGYSQPEAEKEAAKIVALPGTSEHQMGLAVDIVDLSNQRLDESQEQTEVQRWLMRHSWKYGFILRYPSDKSKWTGIAYEPWHYRYVGEVAAADMHRLGQCFEEYLAQKDLAHGG